MQRAAFEQEWTSVSDGDGVALWYVVTGGCVLYTGDKKHVLRSGDCLLLPPDTEYRGVPHQGAVFSYCSVTLRVQPLGEGNELAQEAMIRIGNSVLNFHLWKQLYEVHSAHKDAEEQNIWLSAILIQLLNVGRRIPSDQQTIERLCMGISNDPQRNYTLEEMCELCGYSSNHLIRLFKKYKGISPHEYVTHVKMDKAKELLLDQMSITKVAQYLNYYDANHFSKQFKKKMGLSPKAFVKQSFDPQL